MVFNCSTKSHGVCIAEKIKRFLYKINRNNYLVLYKIVITIIGQILIIVQNYSSKYINLLQKRMNFTIYYYFYQDITFKAYLFEDISYNETIVSVIKNGANYLQDHHKYHTYQWRRKSYHFQIREKLLLLILFIVLIIWLFLRTTNINVEKDSVSEQPTMQRLFEIAMRVFKF